MNVDKKSSAPKKLKEYVERELPSKPTTSIKWKVKTDWWNVIQVLMLGLRIMGLNNIYFVCKYLILL